MISELALRKAGLPPEQVWYCGDTFDKDVVGAHNAGMFPVYYVDILEDGPKREEIKEKVDYPYLTVKDWRELINYLNNVIK